MSTPATTTCPRCGAEPMEDQTGTDWCPCAPAPDGRMCPMTGLAEHGPVLPTMSDVNAHNIFPVPYGILSISALSNRELSEAFEAACDDDAQREHANRVESSRLVNRLLDELERRGL